MTDKQAAARQVQGAAEVGADDGLQQGLAVVLARVRCQAVHKQINGGRCPNCISWAETIGVHEHLPRMVQAIARTSGTLARVESLAKQWNLLDESGWHELYDALGWPRGDS